MPSRSPDLPNSKPAWHHTVRARFDLRRLTAALTLVSSILPFSSHSVCAQRLAQRLAQPPGTEHTGSERQTPGLIPVGGESQALAVGLVMELGAPEFRRRELAQRQLMELGIGAMPAVIEGLASHDAEIRLRSQRVQRAITIAHRQRTLAVFQSVQSSETSSLPGWLSLRELLGDSTETRRMLALILSTQWDLMEQFESAVELEEQIRLEAHRPTGGPVRSGNEETGESDDRGRISVRKPILTGSSLPQAALATSLLMAEVAHLHGSHQGRYPHLTMGHVASLLLMANHPTLRTNSEESNRLLSILHRMTRDADGSNPWQSDPFRELASGVVREATSRSNAYLACSLALRYNLPAGLKPGLAIVHDDEFPPHERQYGILTVARFGGIDQIDSLETLFDNEELCFRKPRNTNSEFSCLVCDVALAAAIHLRGWEPRHFGYVSLRPNPTTVFQPNSMGFENNHQRNSAFEHWETRR